jgi:excisionase family DNA binding protein
LKQGDLRRMEDQLIRAFDVAVRLDCSTETVKRWARNGRLPGVVFIGKQLRFDPHKIEEFIENGGNRPAQIEAATQFRVQRHGAKAHAGRRPRNDSTRRPSDNRLAAMVVPDPGVRSYVAEAISDF